MVLENRNDSKAKHNMQWIEANKRYAYLFCELNDPFRTESVQDKYNLEDDDMLQIVASDNHIQFRNLKAKGKPGGTVAYPISYEYDPYEFKRKLSNALSFFQKRLEINFNK